MKSYEGPFERAIRRALHAELDSYEEQGREEVWARLKKSIESTKPKQSFASRWGIRLGAAAAVLALFAVIVSVAAPRQVTAVGKILTEKIEYALGNGLVNQVIQPAESPSPNSQYQQEANQPEIVNSINETKALSPFPLLIPKYVPTGYDFKDGTVEKAGQKALITLSFVQRDNPKKTITIRESGLSREISASIVYDKTDTTVKEVQVGENKATVLSKNDRTTVIWLDQGVTVEVWGYTGEEEIIKLAQSMSR